MLRADMDALPVEEATGLPYASQVKAADREGKTVPVMDACGHDMHVTWLVGVTTLMAQARHGWRGTLMAIFQPGEETAEGAQAMIDDGLFKRFAKPDVVLGQHVMVGPAGTVGGRAGYGICRRLPVGASLCIASPFPSLIFIFRKGRVNGLTPIRSRRLPSR